MASPQAPLWVLEFCFPPPSERLREWGWVAPILSNGQDKAMHYTQQNARDCSTAVAQSHQAVSDSPPDWVCSNFLSEHKESEGLARPSLDRCSTGRGEPESLDTEQNVSAPRPQGPLGGRGAREADSLFKSRKKHHEALFATVCWVSVQQCVAARRSIAV